MYDILVLEKEYMAPPLLAAELLTKIISVQFSICEYFCKETAPPFIPALLFEKLIFFAFTN